jgi:hypothetical protein
VSVEAKTTAQERVYRNSSRRSLYARISVGQTNDQALGKKMRATQWLASLYALRLISVFPVSVLK